MNVIAAIPLIVLALPFGAVASASPGMATHTPLLETTISDSTSAPLAQVDLIDEAPATVTDAQKAQVLVVPPPAVTAQAGGQPNRTDNIGHATRNLLRLQASGDAAAPLLPMLGQASSAAYKRYLDSFKHSIPDFFDTTVESSGGAK